MEIKRKIKEALFDNTDLEIAHHEIGYLRDLCDAKDNIILSKDNIIEYQKELLNVQSETIKRFRILEEELNELKENLKKKKRGNKDGV